MRAWKWQAAPSSSAAIAAYTHNVRPRPLLISTPIHGLKTLLYSSSSGSLSPRSPLSHVVYTLLPKQTPKKADSLKAKQALKAAEDATTGESIASTAVSRRHISKSQDTVDELEKELFRLSNNDPASKRIIEIFSELTTVRGVTPTSAHYEALVLRNCNPKHGSVDKVKDMLVTMQAEGVTITASVYQAALMVLAVHPSASFQRHIISTMTAQWMPIPIDAEYAIIASLIRDDQLELAHARLTALVQPPEWLFVLLVHALCVAKDYAAILQLAYNLQDRRLDLPRPTWNHILDEAVRDGDFDLALYLWLHHVEPMYITPSYDTCTAALGLAVANTSPKLAESAMAVLESLYRPALLLKAEDYQHLQTLVAAAYNKNNEKQSAATDHRHQLLQKRDPQRYRRGNLFALFNRAKGHEQAFFDPKIALAKRPLVRKGRGGHRK